MGGGGGGKGGASAPSVAPLPKQQQTKAVTEAATAARENQKDKARQAAGLRGSVLTSPLQATAAGSNDRKTLLGG